MAHTVTTLAFDADDTLWHNERHFRMSEERFADLLKDYADPDHLAERLLAAEKKNVGHYGFGVKGFVLSMIETAIEVTDERVPARVIKELIASGQDLLSYPIELMPGAGEVVEQMAGHYKLIVITKGDLLDQERKLAQSGLGEMFDGVEIVSDKTAAMYEQLFVKWSNGSSGAMMIGNSMKSDVIPAIEAGAWGVYVPSEITWALEHAEAPKESAKFREISSLHALPELLESLT
ncbi:HAD family hydrolase [Donghicola sp.]|jgi:putative hydrolase of the HAD superfamily|uniref:HAD family hydrolase n=1 Tax=Donghicola sp. TaxID=1929294 RepID=UPI0025F3A638|nr:HAD family hydrolase [Donghicola sp.]MCT4578289.1 HAD family hydrolase [Donghicola sp.]